MNSLVGTITNIEVSGNLSLVTLKVGDCPFKSIIIETPSTVDYLTDGGDVKILFKETEVIIALGSDLPISLRNRMPGKVTAIDVGALLAKLILVINAGKIISIITANAVRELGIKIGSEVVGMVKTNEILLAKC